MKNYLFAPFKDEEDKMTTWESCKSGIDQGIMIFLGRLESSYDVIISKLQSENAVAIADERVIKGLEDKVIELKADNVAYINDFAKLIKKNDELQAENKELRECVSNEGLLVLQDDNKRLQSIIDEIQADNKRLYKEHKECRST